MINGRILVFVIFAVINSSAYAQCAYSAYVDFGPAVTDGELNKKELVYRSSGLVKNIRSTNSANNYFAAYTSYRQVKVGGFEIVNIGPYDSESVANGELKSVIADLEGRGYGKKADRHSMPAVLISNKKPC